MAFMPLRPGFSLATPVLIATQAANCFWKSVILVLPLYFKKHFPVYYLFTALHIYALPLQMPQRECYIPAQKYIPPCYFPAGAWFIQKRGRK